MTTLKVLAPAKINYLLDVIGKRPDGYHELRMIMQRVNLCDNISLKLNDNGEVKIICNSIGIPDGQENIAWKAARALLDFAGSKTGVTIEITKNIPVAAGLGGGSSDAAAVLMGLNDLLNLNISDQKLMEIGVNIGADVPFFIFKKAAIAEGIGEKLTELPEMPHCWILLVNPAIHVSTAWVYKSLQLTNRGKLNRLPEFFDSIEQVISILSNDLESVTVEKFPVIAEIKSLLLESGASGSMMSGSGPTVFGIFDSFDAAEIARKRIITRDNNWFAATVETI
ncbi:MAG: 4-(cytidine 5'-diphospho)-2-C-methyl-D-erythritol kinase [Desulfuromonadaceae bacterium]|nr:4-(cytidine 5'-diphospho)-2-C-methyl-D-erythritol kinase [Desulfuromonadaceae bacterium]MDD2854893.1 4-(cytidine 5'-diphospho)-2-C-methyl-D-erythritol kinase [Desulfuromonadaceae bacterium]